MIEDFSEKAITHWKETWNETKEKLIEILDIEEVLFNAPHHSNVVI